MLAICQPLPSAARLHLAPFDALFLRAACLAFPKDVILYLTDERSRELMRRHLETLPPNLRMLTAGLPEYGRRRFRLHIRLLQNLIACRQQALRHEANAIVYLAFHNVTSALHFTKESPVPEYYVVHNNLQRACSGLLENLCFRWLARRKVHLIFLEHAVSKTARTRFTLDPARVITIPHPIDDSGLCDPQRGRGGSGIVLAGRLTRGKGVTTLLEAVRILQDDARPSLERVPIRIVGPYHSGLKPNANLSHFVEYIERPLTDQDLNEIISASKFVVVPYELKSYAYASPGAVYRALGCGRPVLLSNLPAVDCLVRGSPPIGMVFSDPQELARVISRVASISEEEYTEFLEGVSECVRQRTVLATARRLQEALTGVRLLV